MIISREQKLNKAIVDTFRQLRDSLVTERGTSAARIEMMKLREQSFNTGECPYCRSQIAERSPRRSEACKECASKIDRLLMTKSKLLNSGGTGVKSRAFKTFINDLNSLQYVPLSLGGDRVGEILDNCEAYLFALQELEDYRHEQNIKKIADNLRAKRMNNLRLEYSRYKDQMSEEEFNDLLESQYVVRYHQDIV